MTIKELKDFIIKARKSTPITFSEVANALYDRLYDSSIAIYTIPTDEELMVAKDTLELITNR